MRIHADHQPYRKKPYVARWYEGTRQRNMFFATAAARDDFIEQLKQTAKRQDPTLPALAPHQLIRLQQAVAIDPEADPVEVFQFWKAEKAKIAKLGDRYLKDAAGAYLQSMERVGRNHSYIGHVRKALGDMEVEFGNRLVREFTADEIRDYLFGLGHSFPTGLRRLAAWSGRSNIKTSFLRIILLKELSLPRGNTSVGYFLKDFQPRNAP